MGWELEGSADSREESDGGDLVHLLLLKCIARRWGRSAQAPV